LQSIDPKLLEVIDGEYRSTSVNTIGAPMGAALPRPIGNKKAKKTLKDVAVVDSPNPVLLEIASAQAMIASSQAAIARRLAIKDKREGLKMEFEMLRELGDLDGAKQVLEKVKALNLEEEMVSSISVSTESHAPPSTTDGNGEQW
jgi:hypothetical protein